MMKPYRGAGAVLGWGLGIVLSFSLYAADPVPKRDKDGRWEVPWQTLAEYDLKKKVLGKNLSKVINKNVSITGFIIPLDYSQKSISEFLLVPFVPACMHVPPPPENMIVNVKLDKKNAIKPGYYPFRVVGKLKLERAPKAKEEFFYQMNGVYSLRATSAREVKR